MFVYSPIFLAIERLQHIWPESVPSLVKGLCQEIVAAPASRNQRQPMAMRRKRQRRVRWQKRFVDLGRQAKKMAAVSTAAVRWG
jgi:hypothetical protein